jgi:protein Xni
MSLEMSPGDGLMRVLLVDAFNLIRRIYEARSDPDIEAAVTAANQSLQRALRQHQPSHAIVVFEDHDRTWRHLLYAEYKAGRSPTPKPLLDGIERFQAAFQSSGVASFALDSYEADDVIATFASGIAGAGNLAIILSSDKLYLQLMSDNVAIVNHFEDHRYTPDDVREKYGVDVHQLVDYWSLVGDSSNNVKGVPGIGAKTAASLLGQYGSVADMLESPEDERALNTLKANAFLAARCKQLVTLKTDIELGTNLKRFRLL